MPTDDSLRLPSWLPPGTVKAATCVIVVCVLAAFVHTIMPASEAHPEKGQGNKETSTGNTVTATIAHTSMRMH